MAKIFDMVSGKWQCEESGIDEATVHYSCPSSGMEISAIQLSNQPETVTLNTMPADLASVNVVHFLQSQRAAT